MEIGPLSNHQSGQRPERSDQPHQEAAPPEPTRKIVDKLDISLDARVRLAELADQELEKEHSVPTPVDSKTLTSPARMVVIRQRIASGFYDKPEVRASVVDKLIDDMDSRNNRRTDHDDDHD